MLYLLRALENCQWWEGFVENVGFKPGVKEWVARGKTGESTEEKEVNSVGRGETEVERLV